MKKGFYGLRGKELSLVTIALMCVVIIMLTWEKTPLLNTFPAPQTRLQLSQDSLAGRLVSISPLDREYVPASEDKSTVNNLDARRASSHSYSNDEDTISSQNKGNLIGSREATYQQIPERRNDGSSESQKEIIEDDTIDDQIVDEEGKIAPIKKEILKPKPEKADGKIKLVVEENYSRQGEPSVVSMSPIIYNVSTIDNKLERNQGGQYISSLLFTTLQILLGFLYYMDIWFRRINTDQVECHVMIGNGFGLEVPFPNFVELCPQAATLVVVLRVSNKIGPTVPSSSL